MSKVWNRIQEKFMRSNYVLELKRIYEKAKKLYRLCMKEIMNAQVTEKKSEDARILFRIFAQNYRRYLIASFYVMEKQICFQTNCFMERMWMLILEY